MITFFTCPKSFTDPHTDTIQRNSIRSWMLLEPAPQIILCGDDSGVSELCAEFGLDQAPQLARNENGVPLVSDVFRQAGALAKYPLVCYINADILLIQDFIDAVRRLVQRDGAWVMIGQRIDIELRERVDFATKNWQGKVREKALLNGCPMDISTDYFVFSSKFYGDIPDFAIGRPAYDNWLLWRAKDLGAALVDASNDVLAIHHLHDFASPSHAKSIETARNRALAGWWPSSFLLSDANRVLRGGRVRTSYTRCLRTRARVLYKIARNYLANQVWLRRVLRKSVAGA
jgi:hypothetical protein